MPISSSIRRFEEERARATFGRILLSYSGTRKSIWDHYNDLATGMDALREAEWAELADTVLVFAGLFAAFLSAFLVFAITQLKPDSNDISKDILLHISLQISNSSVPAFVEPHFSVSSNMAAVNFLLFASLALVLCDAYLAMLTKSWLRDFDRSWRSSNVPEERARAREMRLQGLERWKLADVVALLPLLIQASLVLFCGALLLILFDLHRPTAYSAAVILAFAFLLYLSTIVISVFDTNAPFTSPFSRALQAFSRQSRLPRIFYVTLSCFKWRPWATTHTKADDAGAHWHKVEGTEIHLAISNRLHAATSKAVENLPLFTELFDQWMHTPSLRPQSISEWLPLVRLCLSNASLCKDFGLRSVARLSLCFSSKEFHRGRQAVIEALGKHDGDTAESPSIEQLYIHLLRQVASDWSLACQMVPKLEADRDIVIELRWILNWIIFRFLVNNREVPDERDFSWTPTMRDIISFLRGTAVYIIRNQIVNTDHGLFHSLLLVTQLIADGSKDVDEFHPGLTLRESQTSSEGIDRGLFVSIGDFLVPPESQWQFIGELYAALYASAEGFKHELTVLVILLMITPLSTVKHSDVYAGITYDRFIDPERDLPALMDALWETWKAPGVDHHLLTEIAAWLLEPSIGSFDKPSPYGYAQRWKFQELLEAYDSYTSGAILLMTPNALLFIEATLSFSFATAKESIWDNKWEPQTLELKNPWLVMHVHNTLRRDWRIPGSAMSEVVWGRRDLRDLVDLTRDQLDELDELGRLDRLDLLDLYDLLPRLVWRHQRALRSMRTVLSRRDLDADRSALRARAGRTLHDRLDRLFRLNQESSAVLEMIASQRLALYDAKVLRPDPVALSLFVSQRNPKIFNESRRLILEFFGSTPIAASLPSPDATEPEASRNLCSDFFDSKAIGDLIKWRLLASIVFPAWETLSTQWKDPLAAEVMELKYRMEDGKGQRVDWMARVTPLLEGELAFNEYDFGLSSDHLYYGTLTPTHLRMVATVVEHLGAEGLTYRAVRELEEFLARYSNILCDEEALDRIRMVIGKVPDALESLVVLFNDCM